MDWGNFNIILYYTYTNIGYADCKRVDENVPEWTETGNEEWDEN